MSIGLITNSVIAKEDKMYVNENNISITSEDYNKLLSVGYTEKEIAKMDEISINKVLSMDIVSISVSEQYVKTVTMENEDGEIESENILMSKEDVYSELNSSIVPNATYPSESSSVTVDYKYLTINGTYYYDQENEGVFFVKVNVEWLDTPPKRYEDIISINFTDDVQLKSYYSGGNQQADFTAKFTYMEHFYQDYKHQYGNPIFEDRTTEKEDIITAENTGKYNYDLNSHIAVKFALPRDERYDYENEIVDQFHTYTYYDFFFTLEANFVPQFNNLNACAFAGVFIHQNGSGAIDWGNITFTPQYPYFSYSTSFWVNDPNFDSTVSKEIMFENIQSYG